MTGRPDDQHPGHAPPSGEQPLAASATAAADLGQLDDFARFLGQQM
ncbi:hypothetical protein SAMN05445756_1034 [Kytococcus aerolatus]|uniref:Uncharacterized protein n=1 Tax=Kytococcus aerolatus TaxID=592308 RepID=A0A212TE07_9MICO|nr:hypothetical protein [Kytococcus aerolatus]SNC64056.1 hypothetical protein SAMN05445756_1034 [Kytococcus aerolatus]